MLVTLVTLTGYACSCWRECVRDLVIPKLVHVRMCLVWLPRSFKHAQILFPTVDHMINADMIISRDCRITWQITGVINSHMMHHKTRTHLRPNSKGRAKEARTCKLTATY